MSSENERKATGEVHTSLKAADESFRETKDCRFLAQDLFLAIVFIIIFTAHILSLFFSFLFAFNIAGKTFRLLKTNLRNSLRQLCHVSQTTSAHVVRVNRLRRALEYDQINVPH